MKNLKVFMDEKNYFVIGNTHVFINFNHNNLQYLKTLNPRSIHAIHVFITTHTTINMELKTLVNNYNNFVIDGKNHPVKIIIHLPKIIKELKELIDNFIGCKNSYNLITEKFGTRFNIYGHNFDYVVSIDYDDDAVRINIIGPTKGNPISIKFPEFPYNATDRENDPGIFKTPEMKLHPDLFKDKLIEGFKKSCPEKILSSFKNDEDVWDYIMQKGIWKIK